MSSNSANSTFNSKEIRLNNETDILKYTIFPVLLNEDFLSLAEGSGAKNFYLFLNPVNPNCGFPCSDAQTLKNSFDTIFGENDFEVRFNRNKAIVVKTNNANLVRQLLNTADFLNTPISVKLVTDNLTTRFLIKQVPTDTPICDLVTIIECNNDIKVLAARRLFWEGSPSKTVIVTIPGQQSPRIINFDDLNCTIETFFEKPRQCKRCLQYGHIQSNCSADALCNNCGIVISSSNHKNEPIHDVNNCLIFKCIHCQGKHKSTDKHCAEYFKQSQIVNFSKKNKIPFFESKRIYFSNRRSTCSSPIVNALHQETTDNKLKEDFKSETQTLFSEFLKIQDEKFDKLKTEIEAHIKAEFQKIFCLLDTQKIEFKKEIDSIKNDFVTEDSRFEFEFQLRKEITKGGLMLNEKVDCIESDLTALVNCFKDFETKLQSFPNLTCVNKDTTE